MRFIIIIWYGFTFRTMHLYLLLSRKSIPTTSRYLSSIRTWRYQYRQSHCIPR